MTDGELAELIRDCPTLYHMAERGSWPSIRRHGLRSTSALLDLYGVQGSRREAIEGRRRPEGVAIEHPMLGRAVIRDQKPMDDAGLRLCLLDGLSPEDWYRCLNGKVFFWLTRERLLRLLNARINREAEHDVLELDTAALIDAYRPAIRLSPINSGTTKPFPSTASKRGRATFLPIAEYPYARWRAQGRKAGERAVELTVDDAVPDVARFVRRATATRGAEVTAIIEG